MKEPKTIRPCTKSPTKLLPHPQKSIPYQKWRSVEFITVSNNKVTKHCKTLERDLGLDDTVVT